MEKSSEKKTNDYSYNKNSINTIEKKNSFHSIDDNIATNLHLLRNSSNSKDSISLNSVNIP